LSIVSKARKSAQPFNESTLVIAAVKRGLAVVDVTDRPHVDMGLCPLKYCFGHRKMPPWIGSRPWWRAALYLPA
jgi:hypothetical protein